MNKRILALLLSAVMAFGLLTACGGTAAPTRSMTPEETLQRIDDSAEDTLQLVEASPDASPEMSESNEPAEEPAEEPEVPVAEPEASVSSTEQERSEGPVASEQTVAEDGEYTVPEDVALYLHTFGHLPGNFITKNKARDLGWDSSRGNLWDVAPGKSIGGDRFGNYEGLLPDTTKYRECDVNYEGGYRGAERLIYGEDGSVYYTNDHYSSFTQLY